ncbi:hypothetical protein LEP1GSC193_1738 [Leptospira alstonii serovar Pingchang str. 80-412]|uniref:Uncharacterized protein n=2 Tax=Leptospira alstonii TaxID=28452 RepID=M6CXP9_9LEPT|nr:hypothetical protein LEP1GSC194_4352 [Leptospira alstonii serovar Sichuan str. 79601]EQA78641.1 hypothetical protein LEP1GSC193_1738 [Leptospira alstonii serovar Pingchang str. 80-412]
MLNLLSVIRIEGPLANVRSRLKRIFPEKVARTKVFSPTRRDLLQIFQNFKKIQLRKRVMKSQKRALIFTSSSLKFSIRFGKKFFLSSVASPV